MNGYLTLITVLAVPLFFLLGCYVQPHYVGICLVLLDLTSFCLAFCRGGLFFFEEKTERKRFWVRGEEGWDGRSGERRNRGEDILDKRKIYFQF